MRSFAADVYFLFYYGFPFWAGFRQKPVGGSIGCKIFAHNLTSRDIGKESNRLEDVGQGLIHSACNSLDSTLRTALASFYVSDTDWYSMGGF
jgi:hypothetical protein